MMEPESHLVIAARHRREDRGNHDVRGISDLRVAESQHSVSESAQFGVPSTVLLELRSRGVELCAIDLDDESIAHDEIDASHTRNGDLLRVMDARAQHPASSQRLAARLTPRRDRAKGSPHSVREESLRTRPLVPTKLSQVECGLDDRERDLRRLTSGDFGDASAQADERASPRGSGRFPRHSHRWTYQVAQAASRIGWRAQLACVGGYGNVQGDSQRGPHPVSSCASEACEPPAHADGLDFG